MFDNELRFHTRNFILEIFFYRRLGNRKILKVINFGVKSYSKKTTSGYIASYNGQEPKGKNLNLNMSNTVNSL